MAAFMPLESEWKMLVEIVPVILCGGSGSRLWPMSTPSLPKQFLQLIGGRSTFQMAVERAFGIAAIKSLLVVSNSQHFGHIEDQLFGLSRKAKILLEPSGRNSAPAIAAACAYLAETSPGAVAVFMSADHNIPDEAAFVRAVEAAAGAAANGRIVTLGLRPSFPSTAYGYILPGEASGAAHVVQAFIEKPDIETATRYVNDGYLWNSGTFVAKPATLLAEIATYAPLVLEAARAALLGRLSDKGAMELGPAFSAAPSISIDHAVMEKTLLASVVPASFEWADVGDWNAVRGALPVDGAGNAVTGDALMIDSKNCLVNVPTGSRVALIGVKDIAVVVSPDGSILICDLASTQLVRRAADHFS